MHDCLPLVGYSEDVGTIVVASLRDNDGDSDGDDDMIGGDSPSILCCIN